MKVETGGEIFVLLLLTIALVVHCAPLELKLIKSKSLFESDHEIASKLSDIASLFANERQYRDSFNLTEMSLVGYLEERYFSNIYFGDPKQELLLMFDTTSPMTWVASGLCDIKGCYCATRRMYKGRLSHTYKKEGRKFELQLRNVDGKIKGVFSRDNIEFAGWSVRNRSFGEASSISQKVLKLQFNTVRWDGVFGLARDHYIGRYSNSFMHELYEQHKDSGPKIDQIFSFYFFKRKEGGSPFEGVFGFGAIDDRKYTGDIDYVTAHMATQYWTINIASLGFSGNDIFIFMCRECEGILDTSYSYISGPSDKIEHIKKYLNATAWGDKLCVACTALSKLPTLEIKISQKIFKFNGSDYVYRYLKQTPNEFCLLHFWYDKRVQNMYAGWTFGLPFLTNFYTVFNLYDNRIGFAEPQTEEKSFIITDNDAFPDLDGSAK